MAMVRVITSKGYDYVLDTMLKYYVESGYIQGLAEDIETTRKRMQEKCDLWFQKHCPLIADKIKKKGGEKTY